MSQKLSYQNVCVPQDELPYYRHPQLSIELHNEVKVCFVVFTKNCLQNCQQQSAAGMTPKA